MELLLIFGALLAGGMILGGSDSDGNEAEPDAEPEEVPGERLRGTAGADLLTGTEGNDTILGNEGADTINGGDGDDDIYQGDESFFANELTPDLDAAIIDGGAGDDNIFIVSDSTVTGGEGTDNFFLSIEGDDQEPAVFTDFEAGAERLTLFLIPQAGDTGEITISAQEDGTGSDVFWGDQHVAQVDGEGTMTRDDLDVVFLAGEDADRTFTGSDGDDTLVNGDDSNITLNGGAGDDFINVGDFIGADILGPSATSFGVNTASGGEGNDTLIGLGGDIEGPYYFDRTDEDGNTVSVPEEVIQSFGADTLSGDAGDDVLITRNGATMSGGEGADTFAIIHDVGFESPVEGRSLSPFPASVITDFQYGVDELSIELAVNNVVPGIDAPESPTTLGPTQTVQDVTINVWEDGTGSDVLISGEVVVRVTGGQDLTVADINFVSIEEAYL